MSNQISQHNQDIAQSEEQSKSSFKILYILNNFIIHKYDNLKSKKSKEKSSSILAILFKERWLLFGFSLFLISALLLFVIRFHYSTGIGTFALASLILGLLVAFAVYTPLRYASPIYKLYKEVKSKAVDRASIYEPEDYQQVIYKLGGSFYEEELDKEEIRFEIAIRERKRRSNIFKKSIPLIAIFLVATGIAIFGMPENSSQINLLYSTVAGVSGIVFVTRVFFDIYSELLDEDIKIYETCISILQKAKSIAKEEELDAIKAYDLAVNSNDKAIPFEVVVSDVEEKHL